MTTEREQKLIDIMFEMLMLAHKEHDWLKRQTPAQLAAWARGQLGKNGFYTISMGVSWAVLQDDEDPDVYARYMVPFPKE